jgi:serine/threonine-protein kinase
MIGGTFKDRPVRSREPVGTQSGDERFLIDFFHRLYPEGGPETFRREDWIDIWESSIALFEQAVVADALPNWTPQSIGGLVPYFDDFIAENLNEFVGRDDVVNQVIDFIDGGNTRESGYFLITADPGWGKSAVACRLFQEFPGAFFHAFSEALDVRETHKFLNSAVAWMRARYTVPPPGQTQPGSDDGLGLRHTLRACSRDIATRRRRLDPRGSFLASSAETKRKAANWRRDQWQYRMVMIIDALDENEMTPGKHPGFPLYLPPDLPEGVFVVITCRRGAVPETFLPRCPLVEYQGQPNDAANERDIAAFYESRFGASESPLQTFCTAWEARQRAKPKAQFVPFRTHFLDQSQGNFMYVRCVLGAIEDGELTDDIDQLPRGLENYYLYHWRKMKVRDETGWARHKIYIIGALYRARQPIGVDLISLFATAGDARFTPQQVQEVLREWRQFLRTLHPKGDLPKRYYFYHDTFRDFLGERAKHEIDDGPVLQAAQTLIVNRLIEYAKPPPVPTNE